MRPLILITNDDGVSSPGIKNAAKAAIHFGDVLVVAPITQQSGMGRGFVRSQDEGIIERADFQVDGRQITAYGVHGSPAYAAAEGIAEVADRKPDLMISGINYGCNMGLSLTSSGTMGAGFEAYSLGVPVLCSSLETNMKNILSKSYQEIDFSYAEKITEFWLRKMFEEDFPYDFINVNVPYRPISQENYRWTFQEMENYYPLSTQQDRKGGFESPYRLKYDILTNMDGLQKGSDIYTVCLDKKTSVTPISMDMTDWSRNGTVDELWHI